MILVADSGSTKTDWCLLKADGSEIPFSTEGYNPEYMSPEYILSSLRKDLPPDYQSYDVSEIHFYGAGCYENKYAVIKEPLVHLFPRAKVNVAMDLLASAKALLGDNKGFAGILGTGTNTCIYDGKDVVENVDSLGFIMGDEGSGAYIGKCLLSDYIRGYMPKEVSDQFKETFSLSPDDIIDRVYTQPFPNRFCASFSVYIKENGNKHEYYRNLVLDAFRVLFFHIVSGYKTYREYTFNCTGSVAYFFRDLLEIVTAEFGMEPGIILRYPMDGLKEYYRNKMNL
jgi:N-acetylglucosamine kinase-like BadF-type ATPase